MSLTSGFFDSVNGDRTYNAEQMSELFNGIINDGIFSNIGTAFAVTENSGNTVNVGIGRAWFNSTWVNNDAILTVTLSDPSVLYDRWDAVVIEIDRSDSVRAASITAVEGTAASSPSKPSMTDTTYVHQYPLAYIYRTADSDSISQSDITSTIGTSSCPYITGILETQSIDAIVAQWESQFSEWFDAMKDQLTEDAAGSLETQITALENRVAALEAMLNGLTFTVVSSLPSDASDNTSTVYLVSE